MIGDNGKDGKDGKDGREVEFRVTDEYVQWRYVGEDVWTDLLALENIKGEDGQDGEDGVDGLSAYEIYKLYNPGYEKSEEEWIEDLVNGRLKDIEYVTITFVVNGGHIMGDYGPVDMGVIKGNTADLPIPVRSGYRFLGWVSGYTVNDGHFTNFIPVVRDITLYAEWEEVPLEGIEINIETWDAYEDDTLQINVSPYPGDALLQGIIYESSDPEIVAVDGNGIMTAIKAGSATVTVKTADGKFVKTIDVTVSDVNCSAVPRR